MRAPLLERMPPFEGVRLRASDDEILTNGIENGSDDMSLTNNFSSTNNNNNNNSETYESVSIIRS